jgi:asparagine synthase (glutamine-hydrolysing)
MCGIIGSINHSLEPKRLQLIKHRGPDSDGWFERENVRLGHVRLSIQDLSEKANQPFFSNDKNLVLVFNGEIYNHWEIRQELITLGVEFNSTSDTETIIEGYVKYGAEIFEKLNGIFALALFNISTNELTLVRDRFGTKPLYYNLNEHSLQFSSELKTIDFDAPDLNHNALSNYIRFLWSPGTDTPANQVKKVLPGEMIVVSNGIGVLKWESSFISSSGFNGTRSELSEKDLIEKVDHLLVNAVKRQLLSDVPVGFFLSGGLDSSLLVAIAKKLQPDKDIQCFTIDTSSFAESEGFSNDLDYAKIVAEHLDVSLEIVKSEVDIAKDFDKMIWHLDEPQADPAPLNVLNICKRAAEMGFKVLIGGAGGDDVFSGYRRHQMVRVEEKITKVPQLMLNAIGSLGKVIKPSTPTKRRVKKLLSTFNKPKKDRLFTYYDWLDWEVVKKLFKKEIRENLDKVDQYAFFRAQLEKIPNESSRLNHMLQLEMNSFLVDHNFNYTDKMGMATGVEIRVPFLDNDLVDFSYTIPTEFKLKGNITKYILKKVAERYLPHEVIYRSKAGFGAPVRKWITEDLSEMVKERLSKENLDEQGIFVFEEVNSLVEKNKKGEVDASYSVWAILAIDSWLRQFTKEEVVNETDHTRP